MTLTAKTQSEERHKIQISLTLTAKVDPWELKLGSFVFPPKTSIFEGFVQNGHQILGFQAKTIRMVKFSAQTKLKSGISDF